MAEYNDSTIAKNLKGKIESITYTSTEGWGNQWVTIAGTKYATWVDLDKTDLYPGMVVEHAPFIEDKYRPHKLIATKIVKILK